MCASYVRIKDIVYTEAVLFVHKAKISRLVVEAHLKASAIANAKYPIRTGIVVPHVLNKKSQGNEMQATIDCKYSIY